MKSISLLSLLFLSCTLCAQQFKEKELKTTLNEVTVFLEAAQLFETGNVGVPPGKSLLRIKNLSPFMDEKSIQVKADGDFTILSVNHKFNHIDVLKKDHIIDSLHQTYTAIENKVVQQEARLAVLKEKQSLLDQNKELQGPASGVNLAQLRQAMDFYDEALTKIKDEEIRINRILKIEHEKEANITRQLKEQNDLKILPASEIEIRVKADRYSEGKFTITYLVGNAGWFPKYDIRVEDISKPLMLTYKAEVFQHTGVDWRNVKLRFSNGAPGQSGVVPQLTPWLLNYARYTVFGKQVVARHLNAGTVKGKVTDDTGEVIPGVNIAVKGTTIGTVTDANGNYSLTLPHPGATLVFSFIGYASKEIIAAGSDLNVQLMPDQTALEEVVVTGYGLSGRTSGVQIRGANSFVPKARPIMTTFIENQTTVEIEVKEPYTIRSDGGKLVVDLREFSIPAEYQYYAVPKIDKDAFLVARIVQWDQYELLEGEANLYFEDTYVGRSVLDTRALTDTLDISLGRDKSIVINRVKENEFSRRRTFGSNRTESRGFKIAVRNNKNQPVKLTLFDQLPVAVNSDITVSPIDISGGALDEKTGSIIWQQTFEPQQQKEFRMQYEVKYPKRESVLLE